jgi:dTDP-4-amino-4,6-dideoxygalactose transaminase
VLFAAVVPSGENFPLSAIGAAFARDPAARASVACLDSATSALALGVRMACETRPLAAPEVIVPAYSCPDIPAAVIGAGAWPVPVDVEPGAPYPSAARVAAALGPQTVAVISASLFGRDAPDLGAVGAVCREAGLLHIIDRAQSLPVFASSQPDTVEVYSCGRGKPVSLGFGGVLIAGEQRIEALARQQRHIAIPRAGLSGRAKLLARALLLRAATTGPGTFLARRLPFLGVGTTRYHAAGPPRWAPAVLLRAVEDALSRPRAWPNRAARVYDSHAWSSATPLFEAGVSPPLWRYPVLLREAGAQQRIASLRSAGDLGVSALYRREVSTYLPPAALPSRLRDATWPHAHDLGSRLLTLPVHSRVDERTALEILRLVDP